MEHFISNYANDIFVSKLSLKSLTLLSCCSNKLYNLLTDQYNNLIGKIYVYTWSKRNVCNIYLWGDGAEHFIQYYNSIISSCKFIQDAGILIHEELNYKWASWGSQSTKSGIILNLLDNKYEWFGKFGETINEEDIFFDILHNYYINFELSFDRLTIITGRIRGNSLVENRPSKNIKYF
tara:strand:- start:1410 stop:1946 length:537 start_codon:yes stop_codon:yes gene_type:complete